MSYTVTKIGMVTCKPIIQCPMLHLWAESGPLDSYYAEEGGPLGIWRQWAPRVQGQAMKGGHFFPEDNPDETAVVVPLCLRARLPAGGRNWLF